jgi:hypothetical protein
MKLDQKRDYRIIFEYSLAAFVIRLNFPLSSKLKASIQKLMSGEWFYELGKIFILPAKIRGVGSVDQTCTYFIVFLQECPRNRY